MYESDLRESWGSTGIRCEEQKFAQSRAGLLLLWSDHLSMSRSRSRDSGIKDCWAAGAAYPRYPPAPAPAPSAQCRVLAECGARIGQSRVVRSGPRTSEAANHGAEQSFDLQATLVHWETVDLIKNLNIQGINKQIFRHSLNLFPEVVPRPKKKWVNFKRIF